MAILCKDLGLLFLCVPKTGSTSISNFLLSHLGGSWLPEAHVWDENRSKILVDFKHSTLKKLITYRFITVEQLKKLTIVTTTRNPYDWVLSNYLFQKQCYQRHTRSPETSPDWVTGAGRLDHIMMVGRMSFDEYVFWKFSKVRRQVCSRHIDGAGDLLVHIIKLEQLDENLQRLLTKLGVACAPVVVHANKTEGKTEDYRHYYSPVSRRIVSTAFAQDLELFGYTYDRGFTYPAHPAITGVPLPVPRVAFR